MSQGSSQDNNEELGKVKQSALNSNYKKILKLIVDDDDDSHALGNHHRSKKNLILLFTFASHKVLHCFKLLHDNSPYSDQRGYNLIKFRC